ncbi:integrase [Paenibacillus chondroitinus]|uniref:Integrase n=1 Tax=Paenibacillus chondroitinus TaxID=59842 RepID=A0ABU6DHA6_9BACL|nr:MULTISPECIES: integrase [Paenibacillus]MCY9659526.1 integrase [Paenibacillus anseongense]MEB4796921.1 integrase [Paenibacillus chondroitinus]
MTTKDALVSRETLRYLTERFSLESVKQVVYDKTNSDDYYGKFQDLVNENVIINNDFEDSRWTFHTTKAGNKATILFDLEVYKKLNLSLKCFALQKVLSGISITETQSQIHSLKEAIIQSQGFDKKKVEVLQEYIATLGYRKQSKISYAIIEFLKFNPLSNSEIYTEMSVQFAKSKRQARELPPFQDVLMFDDLFTRFFSDCTEEEELKYSLIYLWWRLTKVIPMRPVELYGLTKDCIQYEKDAYWLVFPREKQPPRTYEEIEVTDKLQINRDLYDVISNYIKMTEPYLNVGKPDILLSYDVYREFTDCHGTRLTKERIIDSVRFHKTIKNFYTEVIEGRYGYEVNDRLTAGDTRHFAFCNMMLQGYNMLSIARIGGHKTLRMQMHYHAHLEHFAESAVQILAKSYMKNKKGFAQLSLNKEIIIRAKVFSRGDYKNLFEVDYGYCTDHPSRCKVGDCRLCEHYYFSPENKEEGLLWLKDFSQALKTRISEQIQFMLTISNSMEYSLKTLEYPIHKQEQLSGSANELKRLMDQKASVDSILLGEYENESK